MSLFNELKRRNVFRVGAAYAVAGWVLVEISSVLLPVFGVPEWALKGLAVILVLGFPVALLFAWAFELTPDGIKMEKDVDRDASLTSSTGQRLDKITIGLLVLGAVFLLMDRIVLPERIAEVPQQTGETAKSEPARQTSAETGDFQTATPTTLVDDSRISVAVLPFVNMSSDPEQDYFSDGISEELLNVLVKVEKLRVPSRTSSFAFKGQNMSIGEIARQLNVAHVLEGSVRKAGNQVRVTAQLIDVASDTHLWSQTYTRTLDDIFAIQDEIANAIVEALKITLNAGESISFDETGDSLAYNHYLKGRYFWHQRTQSGSIAAERELRAAVELDPGFALAWAALADVYVLQPEYFWATIGEAIPKARAALERALILNAESAHPLTTRAYLRHLYDWDHIGAEKDYLEAISIDPAYATAHQWYAEFLSDQRRRDKALEHALIAAKLDPLAPVRPQVIGLVLQNARRPEEALTYYRQALELAPGWLPPLRSMTRVLANLGRFDEALLTVDRLEISMGAESNFEPVRAAIQAMAGRIPVEQAVEVLLATEELGCTTPFQPAWLAALEAFDQSIEMLERCIEKGDPYANFMNTLPEFEAMRGMPRFQALLARINLPVEDSAQ